MTSANPNQFGAQLQEEVYMEQEEEWEREGILDPAWEKQQRKVKLKLGCRSMVIEDDEPLVFKIKYN